MKTVLLISPKDNNFYNFRSELILSLKKKYNVILVCPYGSKIDYFTERGCEFVNVIVDRRGTNPIKDLKLIYNYWIILKKYKPDIVLTYTTKSSVYSGIACRLAGIKYIVNNAGLIQNENKFLLDVVLYFLYKIGYSGASCIMCQNTIEYDYFRKILKKNLYFHVIPGSGVNTNVFHYQPYPEEKEDIVFNYVARIVKIKGIDEFLECADKIKKHYPKVHFVIYGDYDNDDYKSVIDEYINLGVVEYGGIQINMKPFITRAWAVIHPSYYEGMTNVILEHSSMGRPCIASNIPGCKESIEDGITGYLFDSKNIDMMVNKVEQFINLPYEQKKAMGQAARNKMETEFDRNIVTKVYLKEIDKQIGV
jgi:glycosyltransferase involved in cell wall biosynthesis